VTVVDRTKLTALMTIDAPWQNFLEVQSFGQSCRGYPNFLITQVEGNLCTITSSICFDIILTVTDTQTDRAIKHTRRLKKVLQLGYKKLTYYITHAVIL